VARAAQYFSARYKVNTIDGVRIAYPDGWALIRASNTQPVLVMRFEATTEAALARYRAELGSWLAEQGIEA
jgi:phosphomannomutase/phosphoglucomutase